MVSRTMVLNCNNIVLFRLLLLLAFLAMGSTVYNWNGDTFTTFRPDMISWLENATPFRENREVNESCKTCKNLTRNSFHNVPLLTQRANYWVVNDYIKGRKSFGYNDSVTYATHGEFAYLDNLLQLVEHWQGPVSLSIYCPGSDFYQTFIRIQYLRECFPIIEDLVTFHLFFDLSEVPQNFTLTPWKNWTALPANCESLPPDSPKNNKYRQNNKLYYPINVARNIAREMSQTYYVLVADLELYTSPPSLISDFLKMIRTNENLEKSNPRVFVLPVFEVEKNITKLPKNKTELQSLLRQNLSVPFHHYICKNCHKIPEYVNWVERPMSNGLQVFHTAKRQLDYKLWEPFYIGTNSDPIYDERLMKEGEGDKMPQALIMCLLDYDFHILDNAFLVHRPGIKYKNISAEIRLEKEKNNLLRNTTIATDIELLYGSKIECGRY